MMSDEQITSGSSYNIKNDNAQTLPIEPNKFYVNIEFIAYKVQIDKYPKTWVQVQNALEEWKKHLPINVKIYVEDLEHVNQFGFVDVYHDRPRVTSIMLANLQSPEMGSLYPSIVGLWDCEKNQVMFDADVLEAHDSVAFSVALHELGHMFGLPHIMNVGEDALTGFILLPTDVDAKRFVMYPQVTEEYQKELSPIEVDIALNHILYNLTNPSIQIKCEYK